MHALGRARGQSILGSIAPPIHMKREATMSELGPKGVDRACGEMQLVPR